MKFFSINRRIIIAILLTNSCLIAKTQTNIYFNYRYDINENGLKDDCYAVAKAEEGYVLAGSSLVVSGDLYWWEEKLIKLDQTGIIQYIKTYGKDSVDYFFTNSGCIINQDNNNFYAIAKIRTPTVNGSHDEATLMSLNENLDTLWMRRYGEGLIPYDTAYIFNSIICINQQSLIIAGAWKPSGLPTHVYLFKTDSAGIIMWNNSYSYESFYIEGVSVAKTTDLGFLIGCIKQMPGYPESVDPVIIKTDSIGDKEWTKNIGGPYKDFIPMISISQDGNIIVGTSYADTMYTPDIPLSKINIIKMDNEGNIIWNKKYGPSQPNNYLRNIKILNDGSIISVGAVLKFNPEPDRVGWILKTDSEGDSLWYREYYYLPGQESRNYLYDVIETSDHGLIACGYVDPYPPDTGSTDTWVIKLDSIGCEWAGCDTTVGIEEPGGGEAETGGQGKKEKMGDLEIWPNPASGEIHVRFNMDDGRFNKDLTLEIYDIFGRTAPANALPRLGEGWGGGTGGWTGWTVDVSALPPGIYFLSVIEDGNRIANGKFVVSR